MKVLKGGLENVPGYTFSAVKAGIRYADRLDYSLIVSDGICCGAGTFTTNRVCAPPVKLSRNRINNPIKAILINATNANACTGEEGYKNTLTLCADIASRLKTEESSVIMSSTGIIGHQLPVKKMMAKHPELIRSLSSDKGKLIPEAIMTTDTVPKMMSVSFSSSEGEFIIGGTVKGSGMIAPNMATLLSFTLTDAPVAKDRLNSIFKRVIDKTLNSITIDGDMSTNDTAIILSPDSGRKISGSDLNNFEDALNFLMWNLSEKLVADAEGGTKSVKIIIKGAQNENDAKKAAKAVAESLLVKTAFFGMDPNWGRIAAAAGSSGVLVDENKLSIYFEDIPLLINGTPVSIDANKLDNILTMADYSVTIDLSAGSSEALVLTSDLSYDYIKINSEYST